MADMRDLFDIKDIKISPSTVKPNQAVLISVDIKSKGHDYPYDFDFDYARNMLFSDGVVEKALDALQKGATIVTDTNMACTGINKMGLGKLGAKAVCFMADPDVAARAKEAGSTRAAACMEKACTIEGPVIIAVGNAPTALVRLDELVKEGKIKPELVIGVPVGFVNVVESKEIIMKTGIPYIVARGRKGGSNVAAAICNALIYKLTRK